MPTGRKAHQHHHFLQQCSCGRKLDECLCVTTDKLIDIVRDGCGECRAEKAIRNAEAVQRRFRESR